MQLNLQYNNWNISVAILWNCNGRFMRLIDGGRLRIFDAQFLRYLLPLICTHNIIFPRGNYGFKKDTLFICCDKETQTETFQFLQYKYIQYSYWNISIALLCNYNAENIWINNYKLLHKLIISPSNKIHLYEYF